MPTDRDKRVLHAMAGGLAGGTAVTTAVSAAGEFMHGRTEWLRLALACMDQGMARGDTELARAMDLLVVVIEREEGDGD